MTPTQDSTRIDSIAHRIRGFLFCEFEDNRWHSRIDFSIFSQQNLTFKHSLDREVSLEAKLSKRFKIMVSRHFDYSKNTRMIYIGEEHLNL